MGQGGHNSPDRMRPGQRTPDQFQENLNVFSGEVDASTKTTQSADTRRISADFKKPASTNSERQNIETPRPLATEGAITIAGNMHTNLLGANSPAKVVSTPFHPTDRSRSDGTTAVIGWLLGFGLMLIGLQTSNLILTGIGFAVVIASLAHHAD